MAVLEGTQPTYAFAKFEKIYVLKATIIMICSNSIHQIYIDPLLCFRDKY